MKRIRLGNTIDIVWEIFLGKDKDKGKYDLTGKKLTIYLVSAFDRIKISDFTTEFNVLRFTFEGKDQKHAGRYQLTFVENEGGDNTRTLNLCDAFELVSSSCKETDDLSEITLTSSFDALRIYPIIPQVGPNGNWWVDGVDTGNASGTAPDWNASTYKKGHIKNRTHHMQDHLCHYFNGSPIKISTPSGVGYVLLTYDTDLADKFIRIEISAAESKTHEFLDAMGMPLIFRWDADNSTINVESFAGAVEAYGMRAYYSSSAKSYDEYFVTLDDGFIPESVARKSEIATINGESITEGGNIVIEGAHNIGSIDLFEQIIAERRNHNLTQEDKDAILSGKIITTSAGNGVVPTISSNSMGENGAVLIFHFNERLYEMFVMWTDTLCYINGVLSFTKETKLYADSELSETSENAVQNKVVTEKLAELSAEIEGESRVEVITEFVDKGKFLYENETMDSAQYNITDYILIDGVSRIILTDLWASTGSLKAYVIYDETKAVLAKSSAPSATGLVSYVLASKDLPQGAYYMRCSQNSLNPSRIELFFESGGIKPRIEDLEHTTEELSAKIDAIGTEDAEEIGVIRGERKNVMTDFTTFSAQHLNTNTGQLAASKAFTTSAFVEIEGGERYCIGIWKDAYGGYYADTMQEICYYDENKNLVGAETSIEVITAPSAAKYMRFSVLSKSSSIGEKGLDDMSLCEIVKGAEPVSVFDQDVFADVMPKSGLLGKKWLVMGDSNTEHNARAAAKYDEFIAAYTGVVPTNIGKSGGGFRVYGNTAMQFLTKLNSFASDNADYMPDFITIMGGSNDIVYDFENVGTIDDTTDATIFGCIHILRTRLAELYPLVPMAMISVFPHAYSAEKDMTNLVTFNTMLKEYCEKYNVPLLDLYTCSGIRPTEAAFNKKYFSSPASPDGDGLHLNYKGQKLISPRIREFILSYFGEL